MYKDYSFTGKGTKLKAVMTGDFSPSKLGMATKSIASANVAYITQLYTARIAYTIQMRQREDKERQEQQMKSEGIGSKESFNLRLSSGLINIGPFKNQELCR
jgi:hypothetical protein